MILTLKGFYDISAVPRLRIELEPVASAPWAVVDLSAVTYVESSFIAELLMANIRRTEKGLSPLTLVVKRDNPAISKVFDICGIAMQCRVVDSAAASAR